jgi:hypothetical protein
VLGVLLILFVLEDKGSLSDERTRDFLRQLLGALAEWQCALGGTGWIKCSSACEFNGCVRPDFHVTA